MHVPRCKCMDLCALKHIQESCTDKDVSYDQPHTDAGSMVVEWKHTPGYTERHTGTWTGLRRQQWQTNCHWLDAS